MSGIRSLLLDIEPLRRYRDFRIVYFGQLVSNTGRQIVVVALPYQLYVETGSALAIGLLALVQLVPLLAFSLWGGAIADSFEQRRLLLLTQSGLLLTSAALMAIALMDEPSVALIYVVAFAAAAISAIDQPARSAATYRLVPRSDLARAIALSQAGWQLPSVLGPAFGGFLIAAVGLPAAYAVESLTFLVSLLSVFLIAPLPALRGGRAGLEAVLEGLRFVRRIRTILATFVIDLDAMIFGLPVAIFPILALDVFRVGPEGLGLMAAAPALGALVGALFSGWCARVRFQGRAVMAAVGAWGAAITAFGLATFLPDTLGFLLALFFLAVAGGADAISAVFRSTILQVSVPDHLRGRLSSIHLAVVTGGPRIGDMRVTAFAAIAGAPLSVVTGGALCVLGVLVTAWLFPQLASYDATLPHEAQQIEATQAAGLLAD
ncbi:MAG: MFS transporter [Chloroflexi bacterium]|nr:MFS transporter [Chloroflexota bacterium]